jgi:hypothetical protein
MPGLWHIYGGSGVASSKRLLIGGILSAALLSLAACSASATAAPSSGSNAGAGSSFALPSGLDLGGGTTTVNASTILTADVAAAIIGGTPTLQPGSMNLGPISLASYATDSGDNVTVWVEAVPGGIEQAAIQAAIQQEGTSGDMQAISGLGDAAGKVVSDHDATVAFAKNGTIVVVSASVAAQAGTDLEPKVEAVAQQIAAKL